MHYSEKPKQWTKTNGDHIYRPATFDYWIEVLYNITNHFTSNYSVRVDLDLIYFLEYNTMKRPISMNKRLHIFGLNLPLIIIPLDRYLHCVTVNIFLFSNAQESWPTLHGTVVLRDCLTCRTSNVVRYAQRSCGKFMDRKKSVCS